MLLPIKRYIKFGVCNWHVLYFCSYYVYIGYGINFERSSAPSPVSAAYVLHNGLMVSHLLLQVRGAPAIAMVGAMSLVVELSNREDSKLESKFCLRTFQFLLLL